ncbi:MAG: septum formation initiator family protein [Firmicutes bacterium]|nr:septum formation initiator family protein [Bacillota bacterium]
MLSSSGQNKAGRNVVDHPQQVRSRGQRTFRLSRSKLPLIIVGLLLLYVSFSLGSRFDSLYTMQRDLQAIQAEVHELRQLNQELNKKLQLLQSDAYVEQEAREKLGLVKPGETRIVPVAPGTAGETRGGAGSEIRD